MPRFARTALFVVGSLLLGPLALGPAGTAEAASGQVCMGIVIDDGPDTQSGWSPDAVQGADVASGTSDLQALSGAGDPPTQNSSGLVCAINNFPADGLESCLSTSGGLFYYWSYWEGDPYTNIWTYANVGPMSHTVSSGQTYVEGWRYQDPGADNASAAKPSVTPTAAFAQACPGVAPVPSGGAGGGAGGGSGGGDAAGAGSPAPSESPSVPATTPATTTAPPSTPATRVPSEGGVATTAHPGSGARSTPAASHTTTTATTTGGAAPKSVAKSTGSKAALASSTQHGASGGGDPVLPIVLVAGVILLLGGLAWWRWRRRPVED